jgi:putative transposase
MPRQQRHYLPGHVWHITHRCRGQDFLLRFGRDREAYLRALFQARKRFGLTVLHYAVTSNHVHLILVDKGGHVIPRSIRMAASVTAREHNARKGREEAFWEDRYHATAVQTGEHLVRCMIYLDLNMVRAGAVSHPEDWPHCGYGEIVYPPKRYRLMDRPVLARLLYMKGQGDLSGFYRTWVDTALAQPPAGRDPAWTERLAVGNDRFVEDVRGELESRAIGKQLGAAGDDMFSLWGLKTPCGVAASPDAPAPNLENTFLWDVPC